MHTKEFDLGRFSDPSLLILTSLTSGAKHGYAIMEDIASFCGTRLEPGTFSRMLARLERRGWIEASRAEPLQRLYQVTDEGALALERAEAQHQEKLQEGRYPDWQRGRKQVKRSLLTEGHGVQIGLAIEGAHQHEMNARHFRED